MSSKGPIDLTRLPPPKVVEKLDYETIFTQMRDQLLALDPTLADVLSLESEPLVKQLQLCAYRELLLRQRVNESAQGVMLAYALDEDLDNLGAFYRVERLVTDPGDPDAIPPIEPTYESNEDFRSRIQLALDGFSTAGPERAYIFHALSASGQVLDASAEAPLFSPAVLSPSLQSQLPPDVIVLKVDYSAGLANPMPGDVVVTVLARDGDGTPSPTLVNTVNAALSADDIRPMTDHVHTRAAQIIPYSIDATLYTYAGPDSSVVIAQAQQNANAYKDSMRRLGRDITLSGIYAALHVAGVQRVILNSPVADIICNSAQAAHCESITLHHGGVAI